MFRTVNVQSSVEDGDEVSCAGVEIARHVAGNNEIHAVRSEVEARKIGDDCRHFMNSRPIRSASQYRQHIGRDVHRHREGHLMS